LIRGERFFLVIFRDDAPMLLYYAKNNSDQQLGVVGDIFERQSYG
jgi:hypothetical protein